MASFNDIATSLRVTTQLPLDNKAFAASQSALADLGESNNLAFTYYDNLKVFCWNEKTEWVWREVQDGEEDTGLVASDFLYPNGVVYPNPGYEGKSYNFFQITPGTSTKINAGTSITVTGTGSISTPYVISSNYVYTPTEAETPPFQILNEGSGNGIVRRGRDAANFGSIGVHAFDASISFSASNVFGATGTNSFAQGENVTASGIRAIAMGFQAANSGDTCFAQGYNVSVSGKTSFLGGTNNQSVGKSNTVFGIGNNITGSGITALGQAANQLIFTQTDYNADPTKPVLIVGNGSIDNSNDNVISRSDALIVRYNGVVEAPSMTIASITAGTTKTLVTKEYIANTIGKNYKEYVAIISQTSGGAPTVFNNTPLQNELSGPIVFTRINPGDYRGTLNGQFLAGKVVVTIDGFVANPDSRITAYRTNDNAIAIDTYTAGVRADSLLNSTSILIRVYN